MVTIMRIIKNGSCKDLFMVNLIYTTKSKSNINNRNIKETNYYSIRRKQINGQKQKQEKY